MKTIIKEGKKEFIGRCKHCGCEFKYELSDVSIGSVYCPCCSNPVYHPDQSEQDDTKRCRLGTVITTYPPKYIDDIDIPSSLCRSDSSQTDNTITTTYDISTETEPTSDSECFIAFETIKQKDMIKLDCPAIIKINHCTYYFDPKEKAVANGHLGMLLHKIDWDMMKGLLNQDETTVKLAKSNPGRLIFDDDAYLKHSLRNSIIQVHKFL